MFLAHGKRDGAAPAFRGWHLLVIAAAAACSPERATRVQTTSTQADLFGVYERSMRSLRRRDVATYLATRTVAERTRIDSMLDSGAVTFDRYASAALALLGSAPIAPRATEVSGDTAVLVLVSTRPDTVAVLSDSSAITDDRVVRVGFLRNEGDWGISRIDIAHKPEWMSLDAFLFSRKSLPGWSYPTAREYMYELGPAERPADLGRLESLGLSLDDEFLYLRLRFSHRPDPTALGGVRIYLDNDADPRTGAQGESDAVGGMAGWERRLEFGIAPSGGPDALEFRVSAAATVADGGATHNIPSGRDSRVPFLEERGWLRWTDGDLLLRIPRSIVVPKPRRTFAFYVEADELAPEAKRRRRIFPAAS